MKAVLKIMASALLILAALSLQSCHTGNINNARPILIPNGLTTQEVKLSILSAVYPKKAPREWTPVEKMTDNALRAWFGFSYNQVSHESDWFVEEVRKNSVLIGYEDGTHYFRVEYLIENNKIIQRIDGSRNLKQTEDSIHKAVFIWLGNLESRTRESMGAISAMKDSAN